MSYYRDHNHSADIDVNDIKSSRAFHVLAKEERRPVYRFFMRDGILVKEEMKIEDPNKKRRNDLNKRLAEMRAKHKVRMKPVPELMD